VRSPNPLAFALGIALAASACDRPADDADVAARLQALGYVETVDAASDTNDGVVRLDPQRAARGLNLVSSRPAEAARLVDMHGRLVHAWTADAPDDRWLHAELAPDGTLLVIANGRTLEALDRDSRVRWSNPIGAHHDVDVAPDGRIFALQRKIDAIDWRGGTVRIVNEGIAVLTPDGELERTRWLDPLLRDRVDPGRLDAEQQKQQGLAPRVRRRLGLARLDEQGADLYHANSIDFLGGDEVLVSLRELDLLAVIDVDAGAVRWSWGPGVLDGPHHATRLANGHVLIFDNGRRRGWSRVLEVDPSGRIVWEFSGDPPHSLRSVRLGGAQKLSNGNVLVAETEEARALEVTPEGRVVWEYVNPVRDPSGLERRPIERITRIPESVWTRSGGG
jgi:hypothetical protein